MTLLIMLLRISSHGSLEFGKGSIGIELCRFIGVLISHLFLGSWICSEQFMIHQVTATIIGDLWLWQSACPVWFLTYDCTKQYILFVGIYDMKDRN